MKKDILALLLKAKGKASDKHSDDEDMEEGVEPEEGESLNSVADAMWDAIKNDDKSAFREAIKSLCEMYE